MGTPDSACSMDARMRHPTEEAPHPGEHLLSLEPTPRAPPGAEPFPRGAQPFPRGQRHAIHSATLPSVVAKRQVGYSVLLQSWFVLLICAREPGDAPQLS